MQPVRKPFHLDPVFPLELVYKGVRYSDTEWPDHLHDLYELVYIHSGTGSFFIDHTIYEKGPGDLFLIPGNTVHRAFPSAEEPIVSTALFFSPLFVTADSLGDQYEPLQCFHLAQQRKQYRLSPAETATLGMEALLGAISEELSLQEPGYRHAIRLHLQRLLLKLGRLPAQHAASPSSAAFGPDWIRQALRDINRDPVRCGGLAELSRGAGVSPSHFSRVFKELTGMTVTDFVNAKRLVLAKELLLSSDRNIEDIAASCGFLGMRHFYEQFRKLTGLTPKAYRDQNKDHTREEPGSYVKFHRRNE